MIVIKKEGILLEKTMLEFENEGVLNPATIQDGGLIHIFYRAVSKGNHSSIGYCRLTEPLTVETRSTEPILVPELAYESHGVEDPRIVKIDGIFYLTYTAYDGINAMSAYATSTNMLNWEKKGLMTPLLTYQDFKQTASTNGPLNEKYSRYNEHKHTYHEEDKSVFVWDKNLILFPRKINGKFCFIHRIKPDIQIVVGIENLEDLNEQFWHDYLLHFDKHILLSPKHDHEISYIGGGCPPIETAEGWLLIYHGVHDSVEGYVYAACAALLDIKNPHIEIARLPYPLFKPEKKWELKGEVNNVCFPTGTALVGDTLYIYYGAADERIATASVSLSELLKELLQNT